MRYREFIDTTLKLASWYDAKYQEMGDGWMTPAEECNKHLDDLGVSFNRAKSLLDVGCGAGHFLAEADKRCTVLGLEISKVGLEHCAKRAPKAFLELGSIEQGVQNKTIAPFDYIVSIGSLEHVVELPKALDNIRLLLKPDGKFYFYCPNELWKHEDQPNERTMTDAEWTALFEQHGLHVHSAKRWNDSTAFVGGLKRVTWVTGLNAGSGQRPYKSTPLIRWINMDINPKWEPDVVGDWNDLGMFADNSMSLVMSWHSIEHVGCGEADSFIKEAYRVLKPGGSLIVVVPDPKAIAQRFLLGQIDEYIYNVNTYGAYMDSEADRHRWSFSRQGLWDYLKRLCAWKDVHAFDFRQLPGTDICGDWWYHGQEAVK